MRYVSEGPSGLSSKYGTGLELSSRKEWERPITKAEAQLHSMDNDSQEFILSKGDGIKRTIETSVTSQEMRREDEIIAQALKYAGK